LQLEARRLSPNPIPLSQLATDQPARIVWLDEAANPLLAERLRELGFDEGVPVRLLHRGPFGGDPLAVEVGATTIALRSQEAARVLVQAS
jgi:ferrous iron transport protein A